MISWVALDRITEKSIATDPKLRKLAGGRPLRSHAKLLTDAELLAKLRSFGIDLDRPSLERLCDKVLSAQEIAEPLLEQLPFKIGRDARERDWIWICLTALWLRWFPDKPSFEMLDDEMQAGYERMQAGDVTSACSVWLEAWAGVLRLIDKAGIRSIREFDKRFQGTQSLFNWIQELEGELWNAALSDRRFHTARIAMCEESLERFEADDQLITENMRRGLAESYFELGNAAKADALLRQWLKADPHWGWGWIAWSDCYRYTRTEGKDWERSEQILKEGLSVDGVRDFKAIAERLKDLHADQERAEEENEIRPKAGASVPAALPSPAAPAVRKPKVGRNEPCPCGSGKKFKRCCGR